MPATKATRIRALMQLEPAKARAHIVAAITAAGGRLPLAADALGVGHRTLCRWVEEYALAGAVSRARSNRHACECGSARLNHQATAPHACASTGCKRFRGTGASTSARAARCSDPGGCAKPVHSGGLCAAHYARAWRHRSA